MRWKRRYAIIKESIIIYFQIADMYEHGYYLEKDIEKANKLRENIK